MAWFDYDENTPRSTMVKSANGRPFFRKYRRSVRLRALPHRRQSQRLLREREEAWRVESEVARRLMRHPSEHICNVYAVTDDYIDYELLDMNAEPRNSLAAVYAALKEAYRDLDSIDVVYMDTQFHNVGYSYANRRWKLIDFDACGLMDSSHERWVVAPQEWTRKVIVDKECRLAAPGATWRSSAQARN